MPITTTGPRPAHVGHTVGSTTVERTEPARETATTAVSTVVTAEAPPLRSSERATGSANTTRATGAALASGVSITGGMLVVDGFKVTERAALQRSGGKALVSAAARVADTDALGKISASQRAKLADDLLPLLAAKRGNGRASLHDVSARSGAFALLEQLVGAMKASAEAPLAKKIASALVSAAQSEPHAGLRVHMQRRLEGLPERALAAKDASAIEDMTGALAHERAPLDKWLTGTPPTLKVLASVQDEFWKNELSLYKKDGYTVTPNGEGRATAVKIVKLASGEERKIQIDLRERDADVLDGMAERDVDVVLYTGHANLGGVAKTSMANGPERANGDKLVAFFACRSKQNLPALERTYPGQHLLVSEEGTYGHDDAIVCHTLLEGIVRGKSYAEIEKDARKQDLWEKDNYVLPHETGARGTVPAVFVPTSHTAEGTSISFRAKAGGPKAAEIARGPVDDSVAWLATIQGYWAEQSGNKADKALHDKFVSKGWFDGPADQIVKITTEANGHLGVAVNAAYAHQDPDALGMLVTFHAALGVLAQTRPNDTESEKRMLALAMVSSYVFFLVEYSDTADTLLHQFAREHRFPPGLSWPVVEKAVMADMKNDCSPITIAALEKGMEMPFLEVNPARTSSAQRRYIGAALDVLKNSKSKTDRAAYEQIATGRVLVDELADISKQDYAKVRAELAKSTGEKLPAQPSADAFRAITSNANGYAWDNRVYVAANLAPKDLAKALAREVSEIT